ncbi:MAG: ABC transporter substrate-binding protein [Chloroflexi bacterium]|nr:ABC transporter substrate-binding protein [Chloroflexota bacterium]
MQKLIVLATLLAILVGCATTAPSPAPPAAEKAKPAAETKPAPKAKEAEAKPALKKEDGIAKLKVVYTILAPGVVPLWIAFDKGLFKKNDLDVELEFSNNTAAAAAALAAGKYQFGTMSGDLPVKLTLGGTPAVLLSVASNITDFLLYSKPDLTKPQDLKGKTVGVTKFGTGTDWAARAALRKFGLEPDRDYTVIQTGGWPESIAAVVAGGVDAATVGAGAGSPAARKAGLTQLLDMATLDIPFAQNGIGVTKDYVAKNEDIVRRFMRSYVEAIALAKNDKALTKQTMRAYQKTEDDEILEIGYEWVMRHFKPAPYPSPVALQQAVNTVALEDERAKSHKPEEFADVRFIKELEDSGFIKSLYDKK